MRIATLIGTAGLALATTAFAQDISYDYDKGTDFSRIKTYAWVRWTNLGDELNHKRIVDAIEAQLAAKGLVKVEASANPDVMVAYHTSFSRDLEINGSATGWAGYRFGPVRSGSARVEQVVVGTLYVDIVNAKTNTIVWRGIATKDLDVNASPEKRDKNITKAAEKLFKKYPPEEK
jgi:Domain of unknown function (DUF4136)